MLDTCTCSTPGAGTAEHNEITCTNGEKTYCQADEECFATGAFNYGQLSSACRKPAGTSNESVGGEEYDIISIYYGSLFHNLITFFYLVFQNSSFKQNIATTTTFNNILSTTKNRIENSSFVIKQRDGFEVMGLHQQTKKFNVLHEK